MKKIIFTFLWTQIGRWLITTVYIFWDFVVGYVKYVATKE
jgi:hypothetical protein